MTSPEDEFLLDELKAKSRSIGPRAKPIRSVMKSLLIQRGVTDEQASLEIERLWYGAVAESLRSETRPGRISRGVLTVFVSNSLVMNELSFSKPQVLAKLRAEAAHLKIRDLKFRSEG